MRLTAQKEAMSYGKRKHPGPTGQGVAKPFDATGTYSARDMQALNARPPHHQAAGVTSVNASRASGST